MVVTKLEKQVRIEASENFTKYKKFKKTSATDKSTKTKSKSKKPTKGRKRCHSRSVQFRKGVPTGEGNYVGDSYLEKNTRYTRYL